MPSTPALIVQPGRLLVSAPALTEGAFRRTVVYVVDHSAQGTLGVVLNRPSETALLDALPTWAPYAVRPAVLFVGGPVTPGSALCLGQVRDRSSATEVPGLRRVDDRVVLVDLDADPAELAPVLAGVRLFVGYAGWSGGQLDGELARGDWMVLAALDTDVLEAGRVDLWAKVLRRQPMPLALLATHPLDTDRS